MAIPCFGWKWCLDIKEDMRWFLLLDCDEWKSPLRKPRVILQKCPTSLTSGPGGTQHFDGFSFSCIASMDLYGSFQMIFFIPSVPSSIWHRFATRPISSRGKPVAGNALYAEIASKGGRLRPWVASESPAPWAPESRWADLFVVQRSGPAAENGPGFWPHVETWWNSRLSNLQCQHQGLEHFASAGHSENIAIWSSIQSRLTLKADMCYLLAMSRNFWTLVSWKFVILAKTRLDRGLSDVEHGLNVQLTLLAYFVLCSHKSGLHMPFWPHTNTHTCPRGNIFLPSFASSPRLVTSASSLTSFEMAALTKAVGSWWKL